MAWRDQLGKRTAEPSRASGYRWVFRYGEALASGDYRWTARVSYRGQKYTVGTFDHAETAARAADAEAVERGAAKRAEDLNFPETFEKLCNLELVRTAHETEVIEHLSARRLLEMLTGAATVDDEHSSLVFVPRPRIRPRSAGNMVRAAKNTSGFRGVHKHGRQWYIEVYHEKRRWVGPAMFDSAREAAEAYDVAAAALGKTACLNFPSTPPCAPEFPQWLQEHTLGGARASFPPPQPDRGTQTNSDDGAAGTWDHPMSIRLPTTEAQTERTSQRKRARNSRFDDSDDY